MFLQGNVRALTGCGTRLVRGALALGPRRRPRLRAPGPGRELDCQSGCRLPKRRPQPVPACNCVVPAVSTPMHRGKKATCV